MIAPGRYAEIRALSDRLIASCDGGRDEQDTMDAMSVDDLRTLDGMVFCCATCGQWYSQTQNATPEESEWVCDDCNN